MYVCFCCVRFSFSVLINKQAVQNINNYNNAVMDCCFFWSNANWFHFSWKVRNVCTEIQLSWRTNDCFKLKYSKNNLKQVNAPARLNILCNAPASWWWQTWRIQAGVQSPCPRLVCRWSAADVVRTMAPAWIRLSGLVCCTIQSPHRL